MTATGESRLGPLRRGAASGGRRLEGAFGGPARTRVIVVLGGVLALSSADTATVGASATSLRHALGISNFDIGLLVAVNAVVAAVASMPFGVLADRVRRTTTLGLSIVLWGVCMVWSATVDTFGRLILARLCLGIATASAGPVVASMLGDWFVSAERGRVYSYVLTGELLGGGVGFAVTGDVAALSWRLAFLLLAIPAFVLAWAVLKLPEPVRGGRAPLVPGAHSSRAGRTRGTATPPGEPSSPGGDRRPAGGAGAGDPADPAQVLSVDARPMGLLAATRYILSVRTNVVMIVASSCSYFYLAGVQTFGAELVHQQYGIDQALANLLMLVLGAGAIVGVLLGGRIGDALLARGYLNSRIMVSGIAAALAAVMFVPALLTHRALTAVPYLAIAALGLSAQNAPLNAARLDIMPPLLWGRAEGIRTFLRTAAQALAPLVFGGVADLVFGGGNNALHWTFLVMLLPLGASSVILFRAMRTYPQDVATAAAAASPSRTDGP